MLLQCVAVAVEATAFTGVLKVSVQETISGYMFTLRGWEMEEMM
jgi:hypothetical protein